jgi:hypothetical protein
MEGKRNPARSRARFEAEAGLFLGGGNRREEVGLAAVIERSSGAERTGGQETKTERPLISGLCRRGKFELLRQKDAGYSHPGAAMQNRH